MLKHIWFLLLTCEYLLVFLVVHDSKLNICRFWTVGGTKQAISICQIGPLEMVTGIFTIFFTFLEQMIHQLVEKIISK